MLLIPLAPLAHVIGRFLRCAALVAGAAGIVAPAQAGLKDYPFRVELVKAGGYVEMVAHNQGPGTMTLHMIISGENLASDVTWPVTKAVKAYSSVSLGKLFPKDPKKATRLGYTQSFQYGDFRAVHGADVKYRLPYQDGSAYRITQAYGDPLTSHVGHHHQHAVDFAMPDSTPIVATRDGVVIDVTLDYDTGGIYLDLRDKANAVAIGHDDGTVAHYGHLSRRISPVKVGQQITAGTVIGYAGNTGYSSGPHLHYAVTRPEVLADGRVAHVSLPIRFYVDTWTLPFEPRRGALVTASYSSESAMRVVKAPAGAGERISGPEPSAAALIPLKSAPEAAGQQASATDTAPPVHVASVNLERPAVMGMQRPLRAAEQVVAAPVFSAAPQSRALPVAEETAWTLLETAMAALAVGLILLLGLHYWWQGRIARGFHAE